jgi:hypothetical protein
MAKIVKILMLTTMLFVSGNAEAASAKLLVGKWMEKQPDGSSMATEFTPKTITSYSVDAAGKPTSPFNQSNIIYRDLDGAQIGVAFDKGGEIKITVVDSENILMNFDGKMDHKLKKVTPKTKP